MYNLVSHLYIVYTVGRPLHSSAFSTPWGAHRVAGYWAYHTSTLTQFFMACSQILIHTLVEWGNWGKCRTLRTQCQQCVCGYRSDSCLAPNKMFTVVSVVWLWYMLSCWPPCTTYADESYISLGITNKIAWILKEKN